jgi:hypothetical protein
MGKTNNRVISNRRVLGVDRILAQQIAGFIPTSAECQAAPDAPRVRIPFFQGDAQTMRFVSTYSLNEAARGYAHILEFQVIPGEDGLGVRLIVNERLYTGALSTGATCVGMASDPLTGRQSPLFRPVQAGPASFVLADRLQRCVLAYKEERDPPQQDLWLTKWPHDKTPAAVRVELIPLEPDAAKLQVPTMVAPFRPTRHAFTLYKD